MFGSNYFGKGYYAQGAAEASYFTLHTVTATVTALASVTFKQLINHTVSASVTVVATVNRLFNKPLTASVSILASLTTRLVEGLNIRRASTKFLRMYRTTNPLDGANETKQLNLIKKTRRITTGE